MNFTRTRIASLSILALSLACGFSACSSDKADKETPAQKTAAAKKSDANLPNYRYVDVDTVLSRYNLAKDYNEEMMKMQDNMENEVRRHENAIGGLANSIQKKMQSNQYTSEEAYKADQQKYASMQNSAQQSVAKLQSNFEKAAMNAQKAVNDSIEAFIQDYNKKHGYDAILIKSATLYINPDLDITEEVVEGLNARYNKVKK